VTRNFGLVVGRIVANCLMMASRNRDSLDGFKVIDR